MTDTALRNRLRPWHRASVAAVLFVGACCKMTVTSIREPEQGAFPEVPARAGGGEMAAYATADDSLEFCPPGCDGCQCGCPNNEIEECPVVPCADVTCTEQRICAYAPKGPPSCECFHGQKRKKDSCDNEENPKDIQLCEAADGTAQWECAPPDCTAGSNSCSIDRSNVRTCTLERYYANGAACPGKTKCYGNGVCGCPCTEGARSCTDDSSGTVCSDCELQRFTCTPDSRCVDGECRCSVEGQRRCAPGGDSVLIPVGGARLASTETCTGGRWVPTVVCAPPQSCSNGECVNPECPNGRWCNRIRACVPSCDATKCEVLSGVTRQCVDKCGGLACLDNGRCCGAGNLCLAGPAPGVGPIPVLQCN
jgi:hypothetical protein